MTVTSTFQTRTWEMENFTRDLLFILVYYFCYQVIVSIRTAFLGPTVRFTGQSHWRSPFGWIQIWVFGAF